MLQAAVNFEKKVRFCLICFSAFSSLYAMKVSWFPNLIADQNSANFVIIGIMISLSIAIAIYIWYELKDFFGGDWDWTPKNRIERVQNELFGLVGIGALYYMTQMGIMIFFFPSFEELKVMGLHLYIVLFLLSSLIIYIFYRLTVLKFE
ncbi:hypothetical protein [Guptibacillus spartinae]|uniref:hypothetical protein n=1 Tax=Guptibacillus spartinae TaxID=3025679 RepID=UPI0023605A7B|nr:hypothetical protein [Pseudalkalibacillus spartinae]